MDRPRCEGVLVSVEVVMDRLCTSKRYVMECVDEGRLRWVFDLSTGGAGDPARSLYRFWLGELLMPRPLPATAAARDQELADTLDRIVEHRAEPVLHSRTLLPMLGIMEPQLYRLRQMGALGGQWIHDGQGHYRYPRAAVVQFLRSRLIHNI